MRLSRQWRLHRYTSSTGGTTSTLSLVVPANSVLRWVDISGTMNIDNTGATFFTSRAEVSTASAFNLQQTPTQDGTICGMQVGNLTTAGVAVLNAGFNKYFPHLDLFFPATTALYCHVAQSGGSVLAVDFVLAFSGP